MSRIYGTSIDCYLVRSRQSTGCLFPVSQTEGLEIIEAAPAEHLFKLILKWNKIK